MPNLGNAKHCKIEIKDLLKQLFCLTICKIPFYRCSRNVLKIKKKQKLKIKMQETEKIKTPQNYLK